MKKPKVLILTTSYGNGHIQVARALEEQFTLKKTAEVVIRDIYQDTNPRLHEFTKKLYLKSYTKGGGQLYRLFYYGSQKISKRKLTPHFPYGYSELSKIITEEQPDAIINTFPIQTVPYFLLKTKKTIPTYNVVTDYCLHYSWIHPRIDKYYVATPQLKLQLIENEMNEGKIVVSGIPVLDQFQQAYSLPYLFKKYQITPNLKTILLIAGAHGVSKEIKYICENLIRDKKTQILIVCGKNKKLYEQLQNKVQREKYIRVFGYVSEMAELLQLATCVVTKPGGITLTEAMVKNVPIVLLPATPGQENENAMFFQKNSAAVSFDKLEHLVKGIHKLTLDKVKLQQMKSSLGKIHMPHAAETIVNDVLQEYWQQAKNIKSAN
ncbi:MGDG synthase family glycosyltransferase [Bacillus sp. JJ1474]|uniref:MGDG synthase family glycosyltransferase n=1 Tax=Bacillus sp. JJ1474 TaxID=3122955 RepID=UPI002FFF899E